MSAFAPAIIMAVASFAMSQAAKPSMPSMPQLLPPPPTPEPITTAKEEPAPVDTSTPGEIAAQRRKALAANKMYTDSSILGISNSDGSSIDITKAVKLGI